MEKIVKRPTVPLDEWMLERKKRIEVYFKSGDPAKKPTDIKFVKPFTVPTDKR